MQKALIADDLDETRYLLEAILQSEGFETDSATNGLQALELAKSKRYDIIISDILMPAMDGFALCRALKSDANLKSIPFVFYTATFTDSSDKRLGENLGADAFIIKPAEPDVIMDVVRKALKQAAKPPQKETPDANSPELLAAHNDAIFRKLEAKMLELELSNYELEKDVAERKKTEAALREREARYRLLAETMKDSVWVLDAETMRLAYASPSTSAIFGIPFHELLGKPLSQLFASREGEAFERKAKERIALRQASGKEDRPCADELPVSRPDGSCVWTESVTWLTQAQDGRLELRGCTRDVSIRRNYQEMLRQAEKMDAIGQLAGGVAHDFNNQLLGIIGYAENLRAELQDPTLKADAEAILKIARRSADLTKKLLYFARKGKFQARPVSIHKIVDDTVAMLERSIDKRIAVERDLKATNDMVEGDAPLLQNALLNLGVNARDAMPRGGRLVFSTRNERNGEIAITVSDNGIGMDAETKKRLFEPFFTTKPLGKGTGMGLASVYGAVKSHEGRIEAFSELGKGSSFVISLKCLPPGAAASEEAAEKKSQPAPKNLLKGRILYIDDEPQLRIVVSEMLRRAGHEARSEGRASEAIENYAKSWREIDMILLDIVMPDMNGAEAFRALRLINPNARIVAVSGGGPDGAVDALLKDGAFGFLQKPFEMGQLSDCVQTVLAGRPWNGATA